MIQLGTKGLAQSSIRTAYTILRAVLDTAVRDGALGKNPVEAIRRPKVTSKEAEWLSPDQVRLLLEKAGSSRYAPVMELLVNTALRRGEALALSWSDVDLDKSVLRVRGTLAREGGRLVVTDVKAVKSKRSVAITPTTERLLKDRRLSQRHERLRAGSLWVQTGFVFTTETGQPCDPRNALRALHTASKRAKLDGVTLHTLRHSAASVMLNQGTPLKVVSEILGHASVSITGDVYPEVSRVAMTGLSSTLGPQMVVGNGGQPASGDDG